MDSRQTPAVPDKKIPGTVMLIGTFEVAVALLGLVLIILIGQFNVNTAAFLVLLFIYGAMGAGLWAIQEWARRANVILHVLAIPYIIYTTLVLEGPLGWQPVVQLLIACVIIITLNRPAIRHKFQTVVPRQKAS